MQSQHTAWLQELAAAGKGGVSVKAIDRGLDYKLILAIKADYSGDTFMATARLNPDDPDPAVAQFDITNAGFDGAATVVTLSLAATETANLPADEDFDGVAEIVFDILRTPGGGVPERFFGGVIPIVGKVG